MAETDLEKLAEERGNLKAQMVFAHQQLAQITNKLDEINHKMDNDMVHKEVFNEKFGGLREEMKSKIEALESKMKKNYDPQRRVLITAGTAFVTALVVYIFNYFTSR